MAQFGASVQTAEISTGNFRTTINPFIQSATNPSLPIYPNPFGEKGPLGAAYYDATGTASNPSGVPGKFRYVRYLSTSNPTLTGVTGPFLVYWTDATFTTVTPVSSESLTGTVEFPAGFAMPNLTSLPQFNAAQLTTAIAGNLIWICVGGYISGAFSDAAAITAGSSIQGSTTTFQPAFVAAGGTAAVNRTLGWATTTAATNLFNVLVTLES